MPVILTSISSLVMIPSLFKFSPSRDSQGASPLSSHHQRFPTESFSIDALLPPLVLPSVIGPGVSTAAW